MKPQIAFVQRIVRDLDEASFVLKFIYKLEGVIWMSQNMNKWWVQNSAAHHYDGLGEEAKKKKKATGVG